MSLFKFCMMTCCFIINVFYWSIGITICCFFMSPIEDKYSTELSLSISDSDSCVIQNFQDAGLFMEFLMTKCMSFSHMICYQLMMLQKEIQWTGRILQLLNAYYLIFSLIKLKLKDCFVISNFYY